MRTSVSGPKLPVILPISVTLERPLSGKADIRYLQPISAQLADFLRLKRTYGQAILRPCSPKSTSRPLDASEELYRRADFIFERLEDEHAHFYTAGNLGDLYLILGELETAESSFRQTLAFAKKVGDKELEAECEVRFGDLAFFSREMSSAESRYLKAIEKAKAVGSVEYQIRARIGLARLYIYEMAHDKADLYIDQVSKSAKETAAVLAQQEAIFLLGEKARVAGDLDVAAEMYLKVFDYARGQRVFELILKSAIRIVEVDSGQKPLATEAISELVETFIEENGLTSWQKLISSAYFSFFRTTLQKILLDNKATRQLVDFHR